MVIAGAYACMGMLMASLQIYFYGDRAAVAARDKERWEKWLAALFRAPASPA
jgi:hypothetical protein